MYAGGGCVSTAEHKRFVQLLDMRFKDINAYMDEMSTSIDKYLQVSSTLLICNYCEKQVFSSHVHLCTKFDDSSSFSGRLGYSAALFA